MRDRKKIALLIAEFVVIFYIAISFAVYRFRHPKMTETELLIHTADAVTFRREPATERYLHHEPTKSD